MQILQSMLYFEIYTAIENGADRFYSGMAPGTDLIAAEYVLRQRAEHPHIRLIAVLPYADFGRQLRAEERLQFQSILEQADDTVIISPVYTKSCFQKRNQYLVDHSDLLIALYAHSRSGTGQTIRMAERAGIETKIIPVRDFVNT